MKITIDRNIKIDNPETSSFLADAFYPDDIEPLPLVVFSHGYKGYKDWGAWDLLAIEIAKAGFYFVKFNFSHNGTTEEKLTEFNDLQAFAENNYGKELSDLQTVIDFFVKKNEVLDNQISLIGHSRGGGISIVFSGEDPRIQQLITLASVDDLNRFPKDNEFEIWKKTGVYYSYNGRTKQQMPHHFQFFEDFQKHSERYTIPNSLERFKGSTLFIHGTKDEAVPDSAAKNLCKWSSNSELFLIPNANHTFGAVEPWLAFTMPKDLETVSNKIIEFLNSKM